MPPLLPTGNVNWPLSDPAGSGSPFSEDAFSVVDDLDEQERAKVIQDFFEGDKTCSCCINWVEGVPDGLQDESDDEDEEHEKGPPIVIRRRRTGGGANPYAIHAVEIRSKEMRQVLGSVFNGFDGLLPTLRYLTFLAPFRPFYYRWDAFEDAIENCTDEELLKGLKVLRGIIKGNMKSTFTISKDMISQSVITMDYLWTIFRPGDMAYMQDDDGNDQVLQIKSVQVVPFNFQLACQYIDFDGKRFGFVDTNVQIGHFTGTKKITDLNIYPLQHHKDLENVQRQVVARGERFRDLTGVHYKSYKEHGSRMGMKSLTRQASPLFYRP